MWPRRFFKAGDAKAAGSHKLWSLLVVIRTSRVQVAGGGEGSVHWFGELRRWCVVAAQGAWKYPEMRAFLAAASPLELAEFDGVCGDEGAFKLSLWAQQLPTNLMGNLTFEGAQSFVSPVMAFLLAPFAVFLAFTIAHGA